MIQISNANKVFAMKSRRGLLGKTTEVMNNINLEIAKNEFVTIVGPSGCGKTTLLRAIAGLTKLDSGEIRVDGEVVRGPSPERAMVFQTFALMPWASTLRNVAFGLELRGMGKEERETIARELIVKVGLRGFEHSLPAELSGGMRQRVGLARALAVNPKVLLMDEPFGGLDEQTKRLMQEELIQIWESERKTVVFVTHSLDEAILLADRCVLMSARPGRIDEILTVNLPRPRHREVETNPEYLELKQRIWSHLRDHQVVQSAESSGN
ncbi:MAG: ABC transporter ATP-binding protein [Ilumatobacteraceae bacterium]